MGKDLNLKKSWHPVLMSNQRRVWEQEQKALDERKRTAQLIKERTEERQIQELQEMQEAAGGTKRAKKVDWMYAGPTNGQTGTTEEMEGYLLGKRRLDGLLKDREAKRLADQATAAEQTGVGPNIVHAARDTAAKIRDDPMLAIKKQEQAAYEMMMNDPVKRRELLRMAGGDGGDATSAKPRKHRSHRHRDEREHRRRHHRDEDDERDGERASDARHRRRHRSDYDREHSHRSRAHDSSRNRSSSPHHYRRRSLSPPDRSSNRHQLRRSLTPPHRSRRDSPPSRRSASPSRSPSPPPRNGRHEHGRTSKSGNGYRNGESSYHTHSRPQSSMPKEPDEADDDRAARLAAMQQDATKLDQDRRDRLTSTAERDRARREADDAARLQASKRGGRTEFLNGISRQAGELAMSERIHRGRAGLQRGED